MITQSKNREVNIELLRIISMLLVLVIHYNVSMNGDVTQDMVQNNPWKASGVASLKSLSFVCVNCFIVISGYFGIKWKLSGLFKYLFQISFWGGMVHILAVLCGFREFSLLHMADNMFLFLFNGNWFFVTYLGLYLLAPILNAYIEKVETKQLGWMLIAFYFFQSVFGWIVKNCIEFNQGLTILSFVGLYLIGAYLRKTSLSCFQWGALSNFGVYFGVGIICVAISLITRYLGADKDIYSYISPLQIIQTIYLFLACKSLSVREGTRTGNIILFFSSSAFAALLLHSWDGTSLYWSGLSWIRDNVEYGFAASMLFIVAFFVVACCLDKIRLFCWHILSKRF